MKVEVERKRKWRGEEEKFKYLEELKKKYVNL